MADEDLNNRENLYGLDVNFAAANSWYAYFPLQNVLGNRFSNINLHITRFSLPQMEMGSMTASYRGYSKQVPTKVMNADTKTLTLEYIVDEKWENYKALYNWMSGIYGTYNPTTDTATTEKISPSDYIPLRIYLLDNYKKKVIQFLFSDCWIQTFNDLALDVTSPAEIQHSFTMVYDNYTIEELT